MRIRNATALLALALALALAWAGCSAEPPVAPGDDAAPAVATKPAPGRYLVVFDADVEDVTGMANRLARAQGAVPEHVYQNTIRGFAAAMSARAAAAIAGQPGVAYVEADQVVTLVKKPDNPGGGNGGGNGGGETPPPQETPWGIARVGGPGDGTGLTAWVIDTGIDSKHADLNVDKGRSANFVSRGKNSFEDGHGHGTHVAGTIGAIDNDIDVVGVAANASLVAVRVLDNGGSGYTSWVVAGIDYVGGAAVPGDVANMSLGGGYSQALNDAVIAAAGNGIDFALAAGNDGTDAAGASPASANGPTIYTVSAIGQNDCLASFSNWGNPPVDVAAPGVNVLSTAKGGGTVAYNGTSMASPHVAGLLLLGSLSSDGTACGDPDGTPDPIAHL